MHSSTLTGDSLHTYQTLVGNGSARNAPWSAVRTLLESVAQLTVEASGNLTATRNGYILTLHPALTKDLAESGEANALRRFLQDSEAAPAGAAGRDPHLFVTIHGAETRLYRCQVIGGIPQLVLPYEEAVPNPENRSASSAPRTVKIPNSPGSYTSAAEDLQAAGQIVIFNTGTGGEAATFAAWLSQHDSELSRRIIGTVHLGDQPSDPAGLLTAARRFYATLAPPTTGA
jgi:hypothetical protein